MGDVYALPFEDDSFDVTHAHQVLQHVADPVAALREMARVTRPGGIVAARDISIDTVRNMRQNLGFAFVYNGIGACFYQALACSVAVCYTYGHTTCIASH